MLSPVSQHPATTGTTFEMAHAPSNSAKEIEMATALDKNGREVRVGDRVALGDTEFTVHRVEAHGGVVARRPICAVPADISAGLLAESFSLVDAPPLIRDAEGNELRVGDRVKLTATGYEVSVHRVTGSPVVELCEYGAGQPFCALAANTKRLTPPPPAKDAAEGTLGGGEGQPRSTYSPRGQPEPAGYTGQGEPVYTAKTGVPRAAQELDVTAGQVWIGEELMKWMPEALAWNVTYNPPAETYTVTISGHHDSVHIIPSTIAHTRDSDGLRGIVTLAQPGRFDAGHLAAYHAAIGATYQDYRDARDVLGVTSKPYPVDGIDGGTYEPATVPTVTTSEQAADLFGVGSAVHGYMLGFEKHKRQAPVHEELQSQATRLRELARERVRDRYATCDRDDPVRIADAEEYVLGEVGLVARLEKDFGILAELGPNFRRTHSDGNVIRSRSYEERNK
jgi:hypothetical protein